MLQVPITKNRIIDRHSRKVVVRLVVGVDESIRYVRYIVPSVALASDIDLTALELEIVHPVLIESHELLCKFHLIDDVRSPLSKSDTDRLLNPEHVCQIHPRIRVWGGCKCAGLPCEGTILGNETAEGAAARATIEPKNDASASKLQRNSWASYQMTTSSVAAGFVEGKNLNVDGKRSTNTRLSLDQTYQKKSFRVSLAAEDIGTNPA